MKVKELKRTVNVCWSPADHYPVTIAAGSAAQQVDSSFSSSSYLELYSLNLEDPGLDLELKSSLQTEHKFQKIVWSGAGVLVGGCDGGLLQFYSAEKLLQNASDALLGSSTKHNGHVSALDINPYQKNLLASGASESEIFIWDLNNTSQPMAPGNRNQPYDHVQGLAWNQQVQHILGSTFATRCVVWDLRKNEPIMKLSDSQSRTRWRSLAWHPNVATQLCIASEDDQVPVVQLWDLRLAASPLVTLEGHHKGVMSVSWSKQDPDLLLSAGKDGRVLCWNPNNTKPGGELLTEISHQQQWVFDVAWCPRDPGLLVTASFDQQVAVHSLLGGSRPEISSHNASNIMESFGGLDSFSALPAVARAAAPPPAQPAQPSAPPAWLRRPRAARFSFGGKLVTFEKCPQEAGPQKLVYISQVVSEPEIVEKASELDAVLEATLSNDPGATERLAEYCRQKGDAATDQTERYTWFFLRANFMPTFRTEVLNLLGFKQDEISSKFKSPNVPTGDGQPDLAALSRGESTETEAELSTDTSTDLSDAHTLIERKLANLDITPPPTVSNVVIPNGEDSTSLICRALVVGNLEEAVELCLDAKRIADALIIASLGSPELLHKVQKYHLNSTAGSPVSLVAGSLLQGGWGALVASAAPASWRETLAAILTHCDQESASHYCELLGDRLSKEGGAAMAEACSTCYLCAMSADALLARACAAPAATVQALAARAQLALLARRAARARGRPVPAGGTLETVLNEYASRLASQGCLQSALNTLEGIQHTELRDRLMHALGLVPQRRASHQPQPQPGRVHSAAHPRRPTHSESAYAPAGAYEQQWGQSSVAAPAMSQRGPYAPPAPGPALQPMAPPLQPAVPPQQAVAPPPALLQPQAPPPPQAQPPRPGSVGPQGISARSKYKVDPSVQSAPLYNQYSFNNPVTSQPYGGFNSPLPDQYGATSVPSYNSPGPMNQMGGAPGQMGGAPGQMGGAPAVNGTYFNPVQAPEPAAPVVPSKPVPPGWNDPPMLSSKPKPKQEVTAQAPITHPLFGVEPPQHVPLATPAQYPGQYAQAGQFAQAGQYAQGGQYAQPNQYGQQYGNSYPDYQAQNMTPAYPQKPESPVPAEPALPVQKPPLPEQYASLQTVFDAIRNECTNRATNPQMKRKLEDVQRRLETLYDMLREYKLSESACMSLQSCAAYAQAGEHSSALGVATSLATGPDFAAVASFLPGLKMLFQLATQLQVYAR
ncbi:protein transport protein Sec31A isoform X2 [Spodoptera frugiperda]|uniref:Protein transport protein Sec31A isoform X2 n=1 Tax=Spodoptera frugiperda TaxID=7108 RepID=A0A9R0ELZ2_SPOFR|nr:protein transport protein Sec31A isoform X2 [Spodoptera frugiperda]